LTFRAKSRTFGKVAAFPGGSAALIRGDAMTVCASESELGAAFDAFMRDEVEATAVAATQEAVRATYGYLVTLKTTWSPEQTSDIWTGQFRYSTNISIGSPNAAFLPTMEGEPWPRASQHYTKADVISGPEVVASIRFGDAVYITNNSPHAQDVEVNTQVFRIAAELASRDLAGTDWSNVSAGNTIPF
jgi:hypothetical protein